MFNDAHLPDTDAWGAMTRDLRQCKESRNALSKENSYVPAMVRRRNRMYAHSFLRQLKRRLAEVESEKEE
jgi:protein ECT2